MQFRPQSIKSFLLVFIQFACITALIIKGKIIPESAIHWISTALLLFPGAWAVLIMKFRFNIAPDLHEKAIFIRSGPYRYIRHPMYLTVLGLTLIWAVSEPTILRIILWLILLTDIIFKISYEEKILRESFPSFNDHSVKTKKLIPYLY